MDYSSEDRVQCLLVYSQYPPHLRSVLSILHAHGIHAEEGLHRTRGSDERVPALMVSVEDYPRASALADSIAPTLNVTAVHTLVIHRPEATPDSPAQCSLKCLASDPGSPHFTRSPIDRIHRH
jgi:hypothetical protein